MRVSYYGVLNALIAMGGVGDGRGGPPPPCDGAASKRWHGGGRAGRHSRVCVYVCVRKRCDSLSVCGGTTPRARLVSSPFVTAFPAAFVDIFRRRRAAFCALCPVILARVTPKAGVSAVERISLACAALWA